MLAMRKSCIIFLVPILAVFCSFKTVRTVSPQRVFRFDQMVTDTGGHHHHVHGWLDVGGFPPRVQHWDVYYDNTHFQGRLESDSDEPVKSDYSMRLADDSGNELGIESIDSDAVYDALNEYVQSQTQ